MSHSVRLIGSITSRCSENEPALSPVPFFFRGGPRERRKSRTLGPPLKFWYSSLGIMRSSFDKIKQYFTYQYTLRVVYACAILHESIQKRILKKKTVLVHQEKRGTPREFLIITLSWGHIHTFHQVIVCHRKRRLTRFITYNISWYEIFSTMLRSQNS